MIDENQILILLLGQQGPKAKTAAELDDILHAILDRAFKGEL
jgi:hypothetical protein